MSIPPSGYNSYGSAPLGDSQRAQFEQAFQDAVGRGFMGTALVVQNGQTLFNQSFGIASGTTHDHNSTTYRWESVTKVITAVAIIKLAEFGLINLNADITDYLPEYKGSPGLSGIKIYQLLNYTSGVPGLPPTPPPGWSTNPPTSLKDIIDFIASEPRGPSGGPPDPSNPNYQYSDTAYNLLGYLIDRVTGSYSTFVQDFIFYPAEMWHARAPDIAAEDNPQAEGHDASGQPINPNDLLFRLGTGNVYGSAEDLYRFDRALTEGTIISSNDVSMMQNEMYGWFGPTNVVSGQTDYTKAGAMHGGECVYYRFPDTDTTIIILANIDPQDINNPKDHVEYLGGQLANILFSKQ
jgi:CubicO group peptidase (beta-lactamase class C family)